MATLIGGTATAVRFDIFGVADSFDGDITSFTSSQISINTGGGYTAAFTGTGFTANSAGDVTGGTVNQIVERLNGNAIYTLSGLNIAATTFVGWIDTNNTSAAINAAFGGDDNLTGTSFDDALLGLSGHDNLFGLAGNDTLLGGSGNDHLYGQSASGGTDGTDSLSGGDGSDYLQGNAGNDTLDGGSGSDRVNGGGADDVIRGGEGNDTVNGNLGNDNIDGGVGNDSLRGGQGNDTIVGGDGDDVVMGDLGVDRLTGGAGVDTFVFGGSAALFANASADVVTDFADGIDRIQVGYTANAVLTGATQSSFSAAATTAQQLFDGRAGTGEVAVLQVGSDSYIFYSSNNGASADSAVQLIGVSAAAITSADLI